VNKDAAFLQHILDETQFILKNCEGLELQDLMNDDLLQRACLRRRDKLIHHYFGIDWDIVFLINGVPVFIIETKAAYKIDGIAEALDQIRRYHRECPELLAILQLYALTDLIRYY